MWSVAAAKPEMLATTATADAIAEAAAQEAVDALVGGGLIEAAAVDQATDAVAQAEAVIEEIWSATEEGSDAVTALETEKT